MASDALEHTKSICRSVLMANSYGIPANKFAKEYEGLTGSVLPLKKLGIININDLPKIMPDVVKQERNAQGESVFYCVANQKTAHIAKMISSEKKKSGKKNKSRGQRKIFYSDADAGGSKAVTSYGPSISNRSSIGSKFSRSYSNPPRFNKVPPPSSHKPPARPAYQAPSVNRTSVAAPQRNGLSSTQTIKINVPGNMLRSRIVTMMEKFVSGLWGAKLPMEYEKFFIEAAPPDLLKLVIQMDGSDVRIERPFGQNNSKVIIYSKTDTTGPMARQLETRDAVVTMEPTDKTNKTPKYPHTYRYVHEQLPWLGVRLPCYVTLANNPEYFWVQIKSVHLDDLNQFTPEMQSLCQNAPPPREGRFMIDELVCGLFNDGQWYRAIVIDVGHPNYSAKSRMDPADFIPGKPTPQFPWDDSWLIKLFFVDYGNVEYLPLSKVRQQKFPYPPGQAFRCSLGAILPKSEWTKDVCTTFAKITEGSESLMCTTEAVKSEKAHYGFKSRLQEYCQKNKLDIPTYDKPLNSEGGWKTQCHIKDHLSFDNYKTFMGFYQNKKNDSEASAAQQVLRHWDINLLSSSEIMEHWLEVHLEDFNTGEHINKSLVESGAAIAKTSIYELCIPKQPVLADIPMPTSGLTYEERPVYDSSEDSESESDIGPSSGQKTVQREAPPAQLPEIGELITINVTWVTSPKNFCVRLVGRGFTSKLYDMEDAMTEDLARNPHRPDSITLNMLCAVLLDDKNYRGRVLRILKNDKVEVLMLDYGDTDYFKVSEIMYLDTDKYCEMPYQAISCCLYGMENIIDVAEITLAMRNYLPEDITCQAQVKSIVNDTMLCLNVYSEEGEDMNQVFLSHDIQSLKPSLPNDAELHTVLLTHMSRDGVLSLQIPGPGVHALGKMMSELTQYYEERGALKACDYIPDPQEGQICCASFKGPDNKISWYRALILRGIKEDHQVEVQYVDFGNTNCIAISKLREPTNAVPNLSRLPYQSVSVVLEGLPTQSDLWTPLETDTLKRYVKDQEIVAEVISNEGNYPSVKLYIDYPDEPPKEINKLMLYDKNLFVPPRAKEPIQTLNPSLDVIDELKSMSISKVITISPDDIIRQEDVLPRLQIKRVLSVIIPYVEDPSQWAFQPTQYYDELNEQSVNLQAFYSQQMLFEPDLFKEGELCVAYVDVYQGWYRAKVVKIDHINKQAKCFMIDYGDTNMLAMTNLRPLTKAFAKLPIQACTAALANVQPLTGGAWDETAKSAFKQCVLDKHLWVKILMVDSITHRVNAEIIDTRTHDDVHMSEVLVDKGLARPIVPRPDSVKPVITSPSNIIA